MVDIHLTAEGLLLQVQGLHTLWAFKRDIQISRGQLRSISLGVLPEADEARRHSLRLPGTSVPGLIRAGSYRRGSEWAFWDVVGSGKSAVTLVTEGHSYRYLVVDVREPHATVERIHRGLGLHPPSTPLGP